MSFKFRFTPKEFWYILPLFAVSVNNSYVSFGWLCVSIYIGASNTALEE